MSDTIETTNVKEVDVNIDELLGTGIESVMVPGEGQISAGDKKPNVFSKPNVDTTFLDSPFQKDDEIEESNADLEEEEFPTADFNKQSSIDDVLDPENLDADYAEEKNKGGRPTTLVSATKSLIDKGLLLPFEDDKKLEDYTAADYEELIEANMEMMRENLNAELPKRFFSNMPPEMQQAYSYIANGGQDIKGLFQALASSQEMKTLDISTEQGQTHAVRTYLQVTNYGTPEEIEDEINALMDRGDLAKKANQFKPKLDNMSEQIVQQKLAAQDQERRQREQQSQMYMESVYNTLEAGELNGIKLDNKEQNFLYTALVQPNYPSMSGRQTNLLGHLLEKYQWVQPDHALIAEVTYLLADPEGYRAKIKQMGQTAATEETVRKLKTAQANKQGSSSVEIDDEGAGRMPAKRTLPKRNTGSFFRK